MTHTDIGYKGTKVMEVKKPKADTSEENFSAKKAVDFLGDIKGEIKRVNWTSWEELKVYTQIVVGATFFFGIGLYLADLTIQSVLNGLGAIVRLIAG